MGYLYPLAQPVFVNLAVGYRRRWGGTARGPRGRGVGGVWGSLYRSVRWGHCREGCGYNELEQWLLSFVAAR